MKPFFFSSLQHTKVKKTRERRKTKTNYSNSGKREFHLKIEMQAKSQN